MDRREVHIRMWRPNEKIFAFSVADLNHFWGIYFHKNAKELKILKRFLIPS
jgi:hypothetical protein